MSLDETGKPANKGRRVGLLVVAAVVGVVGSSQWQDHREAVHRQELEVAYQQALQREHDKIAGQLDVLAVRDVTETVCLEPQAWAVGQYALLTFDSGIMNGTEAALFACSHTRAIICNDPFEETPVYP